jgi:hypothetical protein
MVYICGMRYLWILAGLLVMGWAQDTPEGAEEAPFPRSYSFEADSLEKQLLSGSGVQSLYGASCRSRHER